jgi:3'-phosphoadenosine 5'-phosphosulfate sulfotransferase (PAPS reductase)/FAD synthetase
MEMIAGLAEVRELAWRNSGDVALVVSHSGGKDSMRMLGVLQRELPELPIYCVLADTGFEHQTPISAEDWVQIRCASLAQPVPVTVVRNPNKTYLEMVERRGRFPSAQYRQCTSDLKRGPIERFIRSLGYKVVINCMGIRAEESRSRAQLQPWSANNALTTRTRQAFNWLPIFGESLRDVLEWHWNSGTPLHPVYISEFHCDGTSGGYLRRFSCRVCIFSTDHDLIQIAKHDPVAFARVSDLEQRLGFTMRPGKTLLEILDSRETSQSPDALQSCFSF